MERSVSRPDPGGEGDRAADPSLREAGMTALATAFGSLGRAVLCLDRDFRILHASPLALELIGGPDGDAADGRSLAGRPIAGVLGPSTLGPGSALREALEAGERREGWRAYLAGDGGRDRLVSLSAAPLTHPENGVCDPTVTYLVVMRPEEEVGSEDERGPTILSGMVARSASMRRIFHLVHSLRHSEATVLITGESGTGKEVLARAIHEQSPRRKGPFVAVNCAALPRELLESELFGHVKGAFTGALRDRIGRFELAADGTLFLDEIAEMAPAAQSKLLRVLQEHTFERLGESTPRRSRARIVAATNRDPRRAILEGALREDLYYRLRVVPIELPPLRDRREDVEPLARWLLARIGRREGRAVRLSPSTLRTLLVYPWPGNVRELENALEFAVATSQGQTLLPDHLPVEIRSDRPVISPRTEADDGPDVPHLIGPPDAEAGEPPERHRLRRALGENRWARAETAAALGISRTTLWRKMREHGLLEP